MRHAHGSTGGDESLFARGRVCVWEAFVGGNARGAMGDTDGDAKRLVEDSGEIGEVFQDHEVLDGVGTTGECVG